MIPSAMPLSAGAIRKAHSESRGVSVTYGKHRLSWATIDSYEQIGTGFWLIHFSIGNEHMQVLLQPDGRNTEDGNFPFWEILEGW